MISESFRGTKVAFLHPRLEGGGSERVSLTTARKFSSWGIHSTFIATEHNPQEFNIPRDVDASIHLLTYPHGFSNQDNIQDLADFIVKEQIQIVFTCYIESWVVQGIIPQLKGRCRWVYWCHSVPFWEILHEQESFRNRAKYSLKMWVKWHLLGMKRRYYAQSFYDSINAEYRRNIDLYDRFISLSPRDKETISQVLNLQQDKSDKLISMTNTLDIASSPHLEKSKVIVWVGRLDLTVKRFDRMLKIWSLVQRSLPDWTLKFYGASHDHHLFTMFVKKYKLERVEYAGYSQDIAQIYNEASVLCHTSTFEGFGMICAEAQNNGVVPIMFDAYPASKDIVLGAGYQAGVLVPAFDLEAYAQELVRLCLDDKLLHDLQQNCLQKRYDYAPDINDGRWEHLLKSLLA